MLRFFVGAIAALFMASGACAAEIHVMISAGFFGVYAEFAVRPPASPWPPSSRAARRRSVSSR